MARLTHRRLEPGGAFWQLQAERLLSAYLWSEGKPPAERRLAVRDISARTSTSPSVAVGLMRHILAMSCRLEQDREARYFERWNGTLVTTMFGPEQQRAFDEQRRLVVEADAATSASARIPAG